MRKFSEFTKSLIVEKKVDAVVDATEPSVDEGFAPTEYKTLLEKYGVPSVGELSEEKFDEFHSELVSLLEAAKIDSKEDFKTYAVKLLKQAHGDDFDQKKADELIDSLSKGVNDEDGWAEAVGKLQKSMG